MAEPVEDHVAEHVIALMADPRNAERIAKQAAHLDEVRGALKAKRKGIEQQQEDLTAKWAAGELSDASYDRALTIINGRLAKVDAELAASPAAEGSPEPSGATAGSAKAARIKEATEDWNGMTTDQKRTTLRVYRVRPVVDARRPGVRSTDLDRVRFL